VTLTPMNEQRRADIRAMLVNHAGALGQPQRINTRHMGLGFATSAAVVIVALFLLAPQPKQLPSYASWTAIPHAQAPDVDLQRWSSQCSDLGVGSVAVEGLKRHNEHREVIVDRRGDFTFCVDVAFGSGTSADPLIALAGIRAEDKHLNTMSATVWDKSWRRPGTGEVLVLGGSSQVAPQEPGVTSIQAYQLYGLTGSAVTGVELVLANGLRMTATLRHGLWGVWWPADKGNPAGATLWVSKESGEVDLIDPLLARLS
jgi:hypothetical protein